MIHGGGGNLAAELATHVLLCLLPTVFIAGTMAALIGRAKTVTYVGLMAVFSIVAGLLYGAWVDGVSAAWIALGFVAFTGSRAAAASAGIDVEFVKVTDIKAIMDYDLMSTPGLVIDEKLVRSGRIPPQDEIRQWLVA